MSIFPAALKRPVALLAERSSGECELVASCFCSRSADERHITVLQQLSDRMKLLKL
jgi:hypothetical protein